MDTILLLSLGVFLLGAVDFITNFRQWHTIKRLQSVLDSEIGQWKEKGTVGEQIGEWLMEKEPDKPSNLEILGAVAGSSMATSMRMSMAGEKSGDARLEQGIEKRFQDYMISIDPNLKDLAQLAEVIGIDPKYLSILGKVVSKYVSAGNSGYKTVSKPMGNPFEVK